jgi:regulation of enolase protein 1 (concanavalin A-like superfamily)
VDPDGDCTFRAEGDRLTIAVPATAHDLSAEAGRTNAPRVLRDVTGDFTAHVTVSGVVRPGAGSTLPDRVPYQGAGLLLWHDANNYVRLERAAMLLGGTVHFHVRFEQRQKGRMAGEHTLPIEDRDTALRLVRRGHEVVGSFNQGGEWKRLLGLAVTFPPEVRVGVTAINSSRQPFAPRFEDFRVTTP